MADHPAPAPANRRRRPLSFYFRLFLSTFQLSAFTFGGGYVIVPLMRKKFVQELGWIDEPEMLDLIAIAQSSPGAMAVNTSILVGYRLAGIPGALLTLLGTVTPPLIILSIISLFYLQFRDSTIVRRVMTGMQAGVVAVIVDVVWTMGLAVVRRKELLPVLVMLAAFVLASVLHLSVIVIVLACGLLGAALTLLRHEGKKEGAA